MLKIYYLKRSDFREFPDDFFLQRVGEDTVQAVMTYRNEQVRRTKLLGESFIRQMLFELWGLRKPDFRIWKGEHGKPFVKGRDSVWFNLSHSGDYLVAAFSDSEVGVDVQLTATARMGVARRFFHPAEIRCLESVSETVRDQLFFQYWSVKESFLKYLGCGLSFPLSDFEVRFEKGLPVIFQNNGQRWPVWLSACPVCPEYACFVCSGVPETPEIQQFISF